MTKENVEEYLDLMVEFIFKIGIEPQLQAFKGKIGLDINFFFNFSFKLAFFL